MNEPADDVSDFSGMASSLERLNNLVRLTRRGMWSCVWSAFALSAIVVFEAWALISSCILNHCGPFPAVALGVSMIFCFSAMVVVIRAAVDYVSMYRQNRGVYLAMEGVYKFLVEHSDRFERK